jgi:endo-1,4-beta-xylanase
MVRRFVVLLLSASCGVVPVNAVVSPPQDVESSTVESLGAAGPTLRSTLRASLVGAHPDGAPTPAMESVLEREMSAIQPTFYPNWGGWLGPDQYNTTEFDTWVNWANVKGRAVHMHMFVGPNLYFPDWFVKGSYDQATLERMTCQLIERVMTGNANNTKVQSWNIANEVVNNDGTYAASKLLELGYEKDVSGLTGADAVNAWHPVYIRKAFECARKFTNATLELRDYGIEFDTDNVKTRAIYQLAQHLLASKAPLDAVGLQAHLNLNNTYDWQGFQRVVRKFKGLGLEVRVTEFDYGAADAFSVYSQQQPFSTAFRAFREAGVEAMFTWGVADGSPHWRTNDRPLMFDKDYQAKPAFYGAQSTLQHTALFSMRARGSAGGEQVNLLVDGAVAHSWVLSKAWSDYAYSNFRGSHNVKLAFVNDGNLRGQDKNVQIDFLQIGSETLQAEAQQNSGNAGKPGEWMYWNGTIDFGQRNGVQ